WELSPCWRRRRRDPRNSCSFRGRWCSWRSSPSSTGCNRLCTTLCSASGRCCGLSRSRSGSAASPCTEWPPGGRACSSRPSWASGSSSPDSSACRRGRVDRSSPGSRFTWAGSCSRWRGSGGEGGARGMAACLLSGYLWLAAGGAAWAWFGGVIAGPGHDAMLHAVFVGFVMSMVFAHAPVILPAVLGGSVEYRPRFYAHLALLHASLVVRILGDLVGAEEAVRWGGLLGAAAILV